jgi:hypothetical protein
MTDLLFAWRAVKAIKSNAIALAKDSVLVGWERASLRVLNQCPSPSRRRETGSRGGARQRRVLSRLAMARNWLLTPG